MNTTTNNTINNKNIADIAYEEFPLVDLNIFINVSVCNDISTMARCARACKTFYSNFISIHHAIAVGNRTLAQFSGVNLFQELSRDNYQALVHTYYYLSRVSSKYNSFNASLQALEKMTNLKNHCFNLLMQINPKAGLRVVNAHILWLIHGSIHWTLPVQVRQRQVRFLLNHLESLSCPRLGQNALNEYSITVNRIDSIISSNKTTDGTKAIIFDRMLKLIRLNSVRNQVRIDALEMASKLSEDVCTSEAREKKINHAVKRLEQWDYKKPQQISNHALDDALGKREKIQNLPQKKKKTNTPEDSGTKKPKKN